MRRLIRPLFWWLLLVQALEGRAQQLLTSNDVSVVISQALIRGNYFVANHKSTNGVVAVVDREGFVLGVWSLRPNPDLLQVVDAISKAGTASFLSSDQDAFTSRTAGYIVQQHFPPKINNAPNGPLVGVNFSSMSISDVNYFKNPYTYDPGAYGGGGTNGAPICPPSLTALSGLNGSPGGVPLYIHGELVGGMGVSVTGRPPIPELYDIQQTAGQTYDTNEDVALAGQNGYAPAAGILATGVLINGIRLPYANSTTRKSPAVPLDSLGFGGVVASYDTNLPPYQITHSPPVNYPAIRLGGVIGEIREPIMADPMPGDIEGEARLSAQEVSNILTLSAQRAVITRAGIRLPLAQSAQIFVTVVNNPYPMTGVAPVILGTFRVGAGKKVDATMFSWDVAVQKARTALYFSSDQTAFSVRAIGFMAQSLYPPGIVKTTPGPLYGLQEYFSLLPAGVMNPLNNLSFPPAHELLLSALTGTNDVKELVPFSTDQPLMAPEPSLPNGITIFPGGFPLYRNGKMIGAIGVSGDGVDQDDLISASGTANFLAPDAIRSDQIIVRGARLPYAKFPRNPSL